MISSAFIYLAYYVLALVVGFFPTSTGFSTDVTTAFSTFGGYVKILNTLLPISTMASVLVILMSVELIVFGFKSFKWIISHIPFVGGRG